MPTWNLQTPVTERDPDFIFLTVATLEATRKEETERETLKRKMRLFDVLMVLTLHNSCRKK